MSKRETGSVLEYHAEITITYDEKGRALVSIRANRVYRNENGD